jgi:hypothetical protein
MADSKLGRQKREDGGKMERYTALIAAAKILGAAKLEVGKDDGPAVISPAWRLLDHAIRYVMAEAETSLRGTDEVLPC